MNMSRNLCYTLTEKSKFLFENVWQKPTLNVLITTWLLLRVMFHLKTHKICYKAISEAFLIYSLVQNTLTITQVYATNVILDYSKTRCPVVIQHNQPEHSFKVIDSWHMRLSTGPRWLCRYLSVISMQSDPVYISRLTSSSCWTSVDVWHHQESSMKIKSWCPETVYHHQTVRQLCIDSRLVNVWLCVDEKLIMELCRIPQLNS